ncbi:MAG: alpha-amylase family glycosyl hydrolase [Microcystaceae cyanobacterium]
MDKESSSLSEFIFGKLSTESGRFATVKSDNQGLNPELCLKPLDPKENEPITIRVKVGKDIAVKSVVLYYTTDGTLPCVNFNQTHSSTQRIVMKRQKLEWDTLQWSYLEEWLGIIPAQKKGTYVQYAISAITSSDKIIYCPYFLKSQLTNSALTRFNEKDKPQIYGFYVDDERIPNWLREAVIYQIFVDRFFPISNHQNLSTDDLSDFLGGTLQGIIEKLDYLRDLGINCLWLTPIFLSSSYHAYDPISHQQIDPHFGTDLDWEVLIEEAHKRNIRVILDYVANHFSNQHSSFVNAQADLEHPEYQWFRFKEWPNEYDCFFDVLSQPEVNSENTELRDYLITNACQWLEKGCDGFRLDYAQGLSHSFWSIFRQKTRQVKADSITIAEITQPPDFIRSFTGRFDGCLDFKLVDLLRRFFAFETLTVSQFDKQIRQHFSYFDQGLLLPSFLDNHDMNRFLWLVKGDKRRLKLAALCQFTLPSPPIIYYGTEVGLSQVREIGKLEESRLPMLWEEEQDAELLMFYQKLVTWRHENHLLWRNFTQPQSLIIDEMQNVYVYRCGNYIVILNNRPQSSNIILDQDAIIPILCTTEEGLNWNTETGRGIFPPYTGGIFQT